MRCLEIELLYHHWNDKQAFETLKSLNDKEFALLKLIVKEDESINKDEILTVTKVSEKFKEQTKSSYASFNRILEKLEFLSILFFLSNWTF